MWLIGFFSCFLIFGILYLLLSDDSVSNSLMFGFWSAGTICVVFLIGFLFRNDENADYELIYNNDVYCHLTNLNYTDERQLMIEAYRFPHRVEYEFSGHTYYRIDVSSSSNGISSYWVKSDNLEIVVADKMVPSFKRLKYKLDKNRPKIYDYFIPKVSMYEIPSYHAGILYLPKEPIYVYGEVPAFLELDFFEYLDNRENGNYETLGI